MIDLNQTRAGLLAEIEAPEFSGEPLSDLTDKRIACESVHVLALGNGREDLFPLLNLALSERFAAVPRRQLLRDLLMPLKNALGNASRHGNGDDPAKTLSVEMVLARKGALVAITDEGEGFNASLTFRRFQERESYFVNHGSGFHNLHRAKSVVSYENGGRTFLLCFRPTADENRTSRHPLSSDTQPKMPLGIGAAVGEFLIATSLWLTLEPDVTLGRKNIEPPSAEASGEIAGGNPPPHSSGKKSTDTIQCAPRANQSKSFRSHIVDAEWLQANLSAALPDSGSKGARFESCRAYAADGQAGDGCVLRFVLRIAERDGEASGTRILTGRLHATEAAAAADFQAATWLRSARISKSVLIPQPMSRFAAEPRLVLYDFDPWMNLWEYLANRGDVESIQQRCKKIGRVLGRMHRGRGEFRGVAPGDASEDLHAMIGRAETNLLSLACGRDLVNPFRVFMEHLRGPDAFDGQQILAPIHGAFGFDCIHCGVDGETYLFGFEACRFGDRGLDLGGFAADLLCFTLANHDKMAFDFCRDTLLSRYNSATEHPMGEEALCLYTVLALCERLRQAEIHAKGNAGELVAALDAALQ